MLFLAALLVDGALAGAVYAPIALAFVVVYKASRMINFALGEWMMVGTRLVASGLHAGFGLLGAVGAACAGMAALAVVFNRVVLRHLAGRRQRRDGLAIVARAEPGALQRGDHAPPHRLR